jgi:hypothetical protein
MLEKIVRPLVQTQIRLLANSEGTKTTLIETITRWLSYLGVIAQVRQLEPINDKIQVSLVVGKPASCDNGDWYKILNNLTHKSASKDILQEIGPDRQRKLARLIAYLVQVGHEENNIEWDKLESVFHDLNLNNQIIAEFRAAVKIQQSKDIIVGKIDADLAAIALPIIVKIALVDQKINQKENDAINSLLSLVE